ncbi:2-C-methyl-D-erythritol 4-phosphate cytidylyltransferase [Streptomyces sp. IMTB 2501]|uniref:IspD/TarI family cytidylyltransferase n=1 Tax=Streptomyces sp. IMTB 2501 TaxID=1776340 RepID=UPI001C4B1099|nr:IspD/TarI family cytidylyltransferase [Streptomyces sp. IMTB 2501]
MILAAGSGERLGLGPKALVSLAGKPMLIHVLEAVTANEQVSSVVITAPEDTLSDVEELVRRSEPTLPIRVVAGGTTRQASARAGLSALPPEANWAAVTDAARPFTRPGTVDSLLAHVRAAVGAEAHLQPCGIVPVIPLADSIHMAADGPLLAEPVDRHPLRAAQTPQVFHRSCLADIYRSAAATGSTWTDEAGLVHACGGRVLSAPGDPANFKITYQHDLVLAEAVHTHTATLAQRPLEAR